MSRPVRSSKKFQPNGWTEKLVPVLLILLTMLLFGTILFLLLSLAGVM